MVFFLNDGSLIFGLSSDAADEEFCSKLLLELKKHLNSEYGFITYENAPDISTSAEFKSICNEINQECFACEVFHICKGGCLNRRLPESTNDNKDYYCKARKEIIGHILKNG